MYCKTYLFNIKTYKMPIPYPKKNESVDSYVERCMSDQIMNDEYPDITQRYAVCSLLFENKKAEILAEKTYTDYPKAAKENAKRALKWKEETGNTRGCGTLVGWARANQLANGEPISLDTVKRMASFKRHQQSKDVPYDQGCGGIMWDAWGGTEGIEWALRVSAESKKTANGLLIYDNIEIEISDDDINSYIIK